MTLDEVKHLLAEAADADRTAEALAKLTEGLKGIYEERDGLAQKVNDLEKRNADLRDSNTRLFLRITGATPEQTEQQKAEAEAQKEKAAKAEADFKALLKD